jgi:hypothetical protein
MLLELGRIIEFDRYAQLSVVDGNLGLLCSQTCDPTEGSNLQILFLMQSNGKRGIRNVEKNCRGLDSSPNPLIHVPYVFLQYHFLLTSLRPRSDHEKVAIQVTTPAELSV